MIDTERAGELLQRVLLDEDLGELTDEESGYVDELRGDVEKAVADGYVPWIPTEALETDAAGASFASWDESKHKRDKGKFAPKEGAGAEDDDFDLWDETYKPPSAENPVPRIEGMPAEEQGPIKPKGIEEAERPPNRYAPEGDQPKPELQNAQPKGSGAPAWLQKAGDLIVALTQKYQQFVDILDSAAGRNSDPPTGPYAGGELMPLTYRLKTSRELRLMAIEFSELAMAPQHAFSAKAPKSSKLYSALALQLAHVAMRMSRAARYGEIRRCPDGSFMPKGGDCSGHEAAQEEIGSDPTRPAPETAAPAPARPTEEWATPVETGVTERVVPEEEFRQPFATVDEMFDAAVAEQDAFAHLLDRGEGLSAAIGARAYEGRSAYMDMVRDLEADPDTPRVAIADMKDKARGVEKINGKKLKGDHTKLVDIVRGTVVVGSNPINLGRAVKMIDQFAQNAGWEVLSVEDLWASPNPAGYRDVKMTLRARSGMITELQLNVAPMIVAKEVGGGHELYERIRPIVEREGPYTPEEDRVIAEATEAMRKLYYLGNKGRDGGVVMFDYFVSEGVLLRTPAGKVAPVEAWGGEPPGWSHYPDVWDFLHNARWIDEAKASEGYPGSVR